MVRLTVLSSTAYKKFLGKKKLTISYAFDETPFGNCLIGFMEEGKICHLSFVCIAKNFSLEMLKKEWPKATFFNDPVVAKSLVKRIFEDNEDVDIIVRGTAFQEKVWRALLKIRKGETCYYHDVAVKIKRPNATRAVANAIARNRVAYLIPCHRIISKTGYIYKYSGGAHVKKKLLDFEKIYE